MSYKVVSLENFFFLDAQQDIGDYNNYSFDFDFAGTLTLAALKQTHYCII